MHIPQSSPRPHLKVQRLARENQDEHPTGLTRAWVLFCSIEGCSNYQLVSYIPRGEVGTRAHAVLDAALKQWHIIPNGDTCVCPTHKERPSVHHLDAPFLHTDREVG